MRLSIIPVRLVDEKVRSWGGNDKSLLERHTQVDAPSEWLTWTVDELIARLVFKFRHFILRVSEHSTWPRVPML